MTKQGGTSGVFGQDRGMMTCFLGICLLLTCNLGQVIQGRFTCLKSQTNSRELDVEIQYAIEGDSERTVAAFKVK